MKKRDTRDIIHRAFDYWEIPVGLVVLAVAVLVVGLYVNVLGERLPEELAGDRTNEILLPASPVEADVADIACHAEIVEKTRTLLAGEITYSFTAEEISPEGYAFIRWSEDTPDAVAVEVNGEYRIMEPSSRMIECLRDRAVEVDPRE